MGRAGSREQDRILECSDFDMEADHMGKACDAVSMLLVLSQGNPDKVQ